MDCVILAFEAELNCFLVTALSMNKLCQAPWWNNSSVNHVNPRDYA